MGLIASWSFSRWDVARRCPRRAELAYVHRIPEPAQPHSPASRGDKIHKGIEDFTVGKAEYPPIETAEFKDEIFKLRDLMAAGRAEGEQMWEYDRDWMKPAKTAKPWLRVKVDFLAWLSKAKAVLIDFKTGKRDGNEVKHNEQTQLYAVSAFLRFPKLEEVVTELWYPDKNILHPVRYTRDQGLRNLKLWTDRGLMVTEMTQFPVKPSTWNCSYCPFKTGVMGKSGVQGTGHCKANP